MKYQKEIHEKLSENKLMENTINEDTLIKYVIDYGKIKGLSFKLIISTVIRHLVLYTYAMRMRNNTLIIELIISIISVIYSMRLNLLSVQLNKNF